MVEFWLIVGLIFVIYGVIYFTQGPVKSYRELEEAADKRANELRKALEGAAESNPVCGHLLYLDIERKRDRDLRKIIVYFVGIEGRERIFTLELDPFADEEEALTVIRSDGSEEILPLLPAEDHLESWMDELKSYVPPDSELTPVA